MCHRRSGVVDDVPGVPARALPGGRHTNLIERTFGVLRGWLTGRAGQPDDQLFCSAAAAHCRATRSDGGSRSTPPAPQPAAPPCTTRRSPPTCCATPPRCVYPRRRRHRSDRAVVRPRKRRTTQIYLHADLALKEKPSRASRHPTPPPAATSHPTRSSRSSTACDYADPCRATRLHAALRDDPQHEVGVMQHTSSGTRSSWSAGRGPPRHRAPAVSPRRSSRARRPSPPRRGSTQEERTPSATSHRRRAARDR